jgi:hypothetical protein
MARSAEARKMLAALDAELAVASERLGQKLVWTAQESAVLDLIAFTIDRKVWLQRAWSRTDDTTLRVKLSAELRLLETSLTRLLKEVTPDLPAAPSIRMSRSARTFTSRQDLPHTDCYVSFARRRRANGQGHVYPNGSPPN